VIALVLVFLTATAFFIVLLYFLSQGRQRGEIRSFRQRFRERRRYSPPEQPIDPTFQFDRPSAEGEEGKPYKLE